MELIAAFAGAIIGAVASFALAEWSRHKNERDVSREAVRSELQVNLELAREIITANDAIDFDTHSSGKGHWLEIIPFSESAWTAVVSSGGLTRLNPAVIGAISRAYAMIGRANFLASKIQFGRYDPREGKEYHVRVLKVEEELNNALRSLGRHK